MPARMSKGITIREPDPGRVIGVARHQLFPLPRDVTRKGKRKVDHIPASTGNNTLHFIFQLHHRYALLMSIMFLLLISFAACFDMAICASETPRGALRRTWGLGRAAC